MRQRLRYPFPTGACAAVAHAVSGEAAYFLVALVASFTYFIVRVV